MLLPLLFLLASLAAPAVAVDDIVNTAGFYVDVGIRNGGGQYFVKWSHFGSRISMVTLQTDRVRFHGRTPDNFWDWKMTEDGRKTEPAQAVFQRLVQELKKWQEKGPEGMMQFLELATAVIFPIMFTDLTDGVIPISGPTTCLSMNLTPDRKLEQNCFRVPNLSSDAKRGTDSRIIQHIAELEAAEQLAEQLAPGGPVFLEGEARFKEGQLSEASRGH